MAERAAMYNGNALKIGLFGANCSSGRAVTRVPERWSGSWPDNVRLARMADDAGIDFLLPIGRWKGYGGDTDYQGASLETVTWASGLLASTRRITVFGTVHAPLFNPLIAAKEFVTADHIGEGRFGLNLVVGWNEDEFEMFGVRQREHEKRYEYAQEWLDAVKLAWGPQDDFDFEGKFIRLAKVRAKPKPYGGTRPLIMNAGASETGRSFALRNCDAFFTQASLRSAEETAQRVRDIKAEAAKYGREIDVYTVGVVTCRPTRDEAEEYYRHCTIDNADWSAVDLILAKKSISPETVGEAMFNRQRINYANGMGGVPIVGDPDGIAAQLADLSRAGLRGLGVSFVNYLDELPLFRDEVLPRLTRMGLRA
jgi:dimethylsulfone monooxygenase